MKKKKSKVRLIRHAPKIVERKPDCPACGRVFMTPYVEVDTEANTRIDYMACYVCGAGFDELGNTWGSLTKDAAELAKRAATPKCQCPACRLTNVLDWPESPIR